MFQSYRRVSVSLFAFVLLALASTTIIFAQADDSVRDSRHHPVKGKRVNNVPALLNRDTARPDIIDDESLFDVVRRTPEPTPTPAPEQPAAPAPQATPAPETASVSAEIPNTQQIESNMIAYWHLREDTVQRNNNGTWQVEVEVRVPTSYRYTFDMDYMISMQRNSVNLGGDDHYTLQLSGMSCRQPASALLIAAHDGLRMETRNEYSYSDGPLLLSFYC